MAEKDQHPMKFEIAERDPVHVLLADDHGLIRDSLAAYLMATGEYIVDTVENYDSAVSALSGDTAYQLALVDIVMPGMDGVNGIEKLAAAFPNVKIIAISGSSNPSIMARTIAVGSKGFIPKTMNLRSLPAVLRMVQEGETYLPYSLTSNQLVGDISARAEQNPPLKSLQPAEVQVLEMVADGKTNKEIGWALGATEIVVKMHVRNACKKLGAKNRTHAVVIARQLGLFL